MVNSYPTTNDQRGVKPLARLGTLKYEASPSVRITSHSEKGSALVVLKRPRIDLVRGIFSDNPRQTGFPET
jgi:hypothetical protein